MIESILNDVWHRHRENDFDTAVHLFARSGRGYHNIVITLFNNHGIIFYEAEDPVLYVGGNPRTRVVMNMDAIDSIELRDYQ